MKPRRLLSATTLSMVTTSVVIERRTLRAGPRGGAGVLLYSAPRMPIYEYRCENGHHFDALQRISDDPLTECEVCGAPVARVLQPVAVHFKGSGFYNTDYGKMKRRKDGASADTGD